MRPEKDWPYFMFEVGRYEPFDNASEEEKQKFIPYKPQTQELEWFVFVQDYNVRRIVPMNVFKGSITFLRHLLEAKKKYKDNFVKFASEVRNALMYSYGFKAEWETVITSWPPYPDDGEIERLSKARQESLKGNHRFYSGDIQLRIEYKIDVYTQVMMNWDRFIDYLWNNKRLITRKKLA